MALTIVQRTLGGNEVDAVVVRGTGATEEIIIIEHFQKEDLALLNEVDATVGANFAAKLAATQLSIGRPAADYFAPRIVFTEAYQARLERVAQNADPVAAIAALDARITALETAGP